MAGADDSTLEGDDFLDCKLRIKDAERAILQAPAVVENLNYLAQAGANKAEILQLLAISASHENETILDGMRKKARQLVRLSQALEELATQVESTFADSFTFSAVWVAFLVTPRDKFPDVDGLKRFANPAVTQMRKLSKALYWEDRKLRKLSALYPNFMANRFLFALLQSVQRDTGNFHDEPLADLLQAGHQALGSPKEFTGEGLRKFRQRHARSLLRYRATANDITISAMLEGLY
ncbi:MAG: hypothetical protein WA708_01350 [Acidobacteriaceae bacterium]